MKAIVIVNPCARSGQAQGNAASLREDVEQRLTATGEISEVDWIETQYPRHATQLAQDAAKHGYGCVIAAGGDGTASEVVNGLMRSSVKPEQRPLLGVLPWGTSNDFFTALRSAEQGAFTQPMDVGEVHLDKLTCYSCLSVSIGLSSWANEQYQRAVPQFTRRFAHIPAVINTLLSYKFPSKVQICIDNGPQQIKPMLFMAINNTASVAGGVRFTPDASVDDGRFDVCRVAPIPPWQLAFLLLKAQLGLPLRSYAAEIISVHDISIKAERPVPVHVDGEMVPELNSLVRRLNVHVMPAALRVLAPSILHSQS